jgi:hypothetical protein
MSLNTVYERDLLYPTDNISDPGSIHVEILNPTKAGRMPVVIDCKTTHSPVKNISSIIRVMQSDIFDRILVDIKKNVDLYIKTVSFEDLKNQYGDAAYLKVVFDGEHVLYEGVNEAKV